MLAKDFKKTETNLKLMNTPITSNFFKKIELYQEMVSQDRLFKHSLKNLNLKDPTYSTWVVEKKILYWTRWGHKHLGSPIDRSRLTNQKDLQDLMITPEEAKVAGRKDTIQNLVQRGLAEYADNNKKGVLFTEKGLLMGSVVYETHRPKLITWQKFWKSYRAKFSSEIFLRHRLSYWIYRTIIIAGWTVFISAVIFVVVKTWKTIF